MILKVDTVHLLSTSLKMTCQHLLYAMGPQILIDTDDLNGRTLTAVLNVRKDLSNAGAQVVDESVVVDKKYRNKPYTRRFRRFQ
ncbi:intracellular protease amidase [Staphylococcus gallinarum]|uniref:Intracellular protease amidase n=1 Tax=Staphylococcus gallinarum TaxID=1293 RepID=A0A380FII3_STAGA|nr:intracellular protease amidase [Staphylococcus gallinarum]